MLAAAVLLAGALAGCGNEAADTEQVPGAADTVVEEATENGADTELEETKTKGDTALSDAVDEEKNGAIGLQEQDLNDSYWRAVYYESFAYGDLEAYVTRFDEDHYRFMDVTFGSDKTAKFRSIVGDSYETASGEAQWKITPNNEVVLEDMEPFDGMRRGYGYIPRFYPADPENTPNHEEGLLALEYMDGCAYFQKMEASDPFEGMDLANADRLRAAMERARWEGHDITGEWVLFSGETDGNMWYASENGIECVLYIVDTVATYQYKDAAGNQEAYYGMKMTYDDMALYTDLPCSYSIYFHPDPSEYEDRYEYMNFGMAPVGEELIVQLSVFEQGQEDMTQSFLTFRKDL